MKRTPGVADLLDHLRGLGRRVVAGDDHLEVLVALGEDRGQRALAQQLEAVVGRDHEADQRRGFGEGRLVVGALAQLVETPALLGAALVDRLQHLLLQGGARRRVAGDRLEARLDPGLDLVDPRDDPLFALRHLAQFLLDPVEARVQVEHRVLDPVQVRGEAGDVGGGEAIREPAARLRAGIRHRAILSEPIDFGPACADRLACCSMRRANQVPVWLGGLVVALLGWQIAFQTPTFGLDSSWNAGLAMAVEQGLHFGDQIAFSYGPLGFLQSRAVFFGGQADLSVLYSGALYVLFCIGLVWALRRAVPLLLAALIALLAVAVLPLALLEVFPAERGVRLLLAARSRAPVADARPLVSRRPPTPRPRRCQALDRAADRRGPADRADRGAGGPAADRRLRRPPPGRAGGALGATGQASATSAPSSGTPWSSPAATARRCCGSTKCATGR